MPLSKHFGGHGKKVMASMRKTYGAKKGKRVFYATENARKLGPVKHKGSLRNAVRKHKSKPPSQLSPFYKKRHRTYDV